MKRLTDWLAYLVVRLFICLVQALSLETCHAISAGWLGWPATSSGCGNKSSTTTSATCFPMVGLRPA